MAISLVFSSYSLSHFKDSYDSVEDFPGALVIKNPHANAEDTEMQVQCLGRDDPLEEGTATHSSVLAWRIPWAGEPGGLQLTGSHRV